MLDLISATVTNPKLWQGCDKHIPRHQPNQSVFHLSSPQVNYLVQMQLPLLLHWYSRLFNLNSILFVQLLVMAEYIVEEISLVEIKSTKFSISNLLGPSTQNVTSNNSRKTKHDLQDRVRLWLQCCYDDKEIINSAIRTMLEKKYRILTQLIYCKYLLEIITANDIFIR